MSNRLNVGDPAPDFSLPDSEGAMFRLSEHRGSTVVVYFYPAAMTPGCTKQACDFRDEMPKLSANNVVVVGISPDKPEKLAKFAARDDLNFTLLSDVDKTALEAYGAWGEKTMYGKTRLGVIRSTFVVGPDGTLAHAAYNVRATGHVGRLMPVLDAFLQEPADGR